jgi:hypothetical protein
VILPRLSFQTTDGLTKPERRAASPPSKKQKKNAPTPRTFEDIKNLNNGSDSPEFRQVSVTSDPFLRQPWAQPWP